MFFFGSTALAFKSNPLSLPPPRRVYDLRKGEIGIFPLFVYHLDNHFKNRSGSKIAATCFIPNGGGFVQSWG